MFCLLTLHVHCTWSIRDGPDECGQHLDGRSGVGVTVEPIVHLPSEPVHDVLQRLIRETHGVQVLINLRNRHRAETGGVRVIRTCQNIINTFEYEREWGTVRNSHIIYTREMQNSNCFNKSSSCQSWTTDKSMWRFNKLQITVETWLTFHIMLVVNHYHMSSILIYKIINLGWFASISSLFNLRLCYHFTNCMRGMLGDGVLRLSGGLKDQYIDLHHLTHISWNRSKAPKPLWILTVL